jgi:hypothetical protein
VSEDVEAGTTPRPVTGYEPAGWLRLLVVLWSGPHWWATHLGLTYLVVPETCELGLEWTLHVITAGTALGCLVGWWVSRGVIRRAGGFREVDRHARRDAYLGWIGVFLGLFFLAVTLMEGVPAFFLSPCW